MTHYILVGQTPVPCDLMEWAQWMETEDRHVARTRILDLVEVSTVFLGLDHSFYSGPPVLFESMAFWLGEGGYEQDRCSTWDQAEAMHWHMVAEVQKPSAVWAYLKRRLQSTIEDASRDWKRHWRDLLNIPPSELEAMMERMPLRER